MWREAVSSIDLVWAFAFVVAHGGCIANYDDFVGAKRIAEECRLGDGGRAEECGGETRAQELSPDAPYVETHTTNAAAEIDATPLCVVVAH